MSISISGYENLSLKLNNTWIMQSDLRNWDHIKEMIAFVKSGGFWTEENLKQYAESHGLQRVSPLIAISKFDDGLNFIHDGHHRCVATYLAGRNWLRSDEYIVKEWNYEEYCEIAPHNGWYTPFNPKIHVRTADFSKFKSQAKILFESDPVEAVDWLYQHLKDYRTDRIIRYLPELSAMMNYPRP
jgi:hypothetical protein